VTANRPVAGQERSTDQTIAECLAIENQEEVSLARLAAAKSKDDKIRQFAEMLIKEHTEQLSQLQQFGGQVAQREPAGQPGQQKTAEQDAQAPRGQVADGRRQTGGKQFDFIEVKQQMAQMCLANAQREWEEKKAGDAELCYLGAQIVAHQKMVDGQKVLRQYASPQLQQVLDKGIEAAQKHLEHAEHLMKSLASDSKESDSKRDRS
jgi:predicted outer membrane protein